MYVVMTLRGKGKANADDVTISLFSDLDDAEKYCTDNTLKGKYWVYCEVIMTDYPIETFYPFENE